MAGSNDEEPIVIIALVLLVLVIAVLAATFTSCAGMVGSTP